MSSVMPVEKRDYAVNRRLLLLSVIALGIGALSTVAADVLVNLIRFFTNLFFYQTLSLAERSPAGHALGAWVIAVPVVGGLVVGLMARYGSDKIRGHGIPEAIEAVLFGKSRMSPRVAVLKPLSSGIVIGSGGPFGAEGPIIMTGGSLASLLAQYLHLTAGERKALLVAGACAGMTAIFGTPVAAVLLAVELLLFELRPRSLLPVALACAVAGFLRPLLFEAGPLFPLQTAAAGTPALLSCVLAGLLCGVLGAGLTLALYRTEDAFARLPLHWMWWPALGGLVVGIGGYFEPRALGVGYDVIGDLLNNRIAIEIALALLAVKAVIWIAALGSGTSGGVLAPLLMLGAGLGVVLAPWLPGGSPQLWALVCMAGVLGSVLGAPLTAIVFAFGLTHDTEALLPLLLTTAVAYGFSVLAMKRSIMTEKIARRGLHIYREYSVDPLERAHVDELMTREVVAIDADLPVAEAMVRYFGEHAAHRAYPVVADGRVLGMLERAAIRGLAAGEVPPGLRCRDLLGAPAHVLLPGQSARAAAGSMAALSVARLPVVESVDTMRLAGIVSLRDLLRPSGNVFHEESRRERLRGRAAA
ncbi:Cl-channel, voltage gated [Cupriavidus taiwanensis]|uniref:Cl-channel, voltage gated n=1 Tax=Cupriavidus taiwanensis TaxID=164546 RepID=A0A375E871_9BURK|nr:chloride channel protein [Cupriavidus taiwanensis]SOZ15352.1 Cl-channel, voltage gated [Cupriavidus taiwanensis]SOZ27596.1 Cl-channel, voltage gated [Cupriavidus taiwanensis]SOZ45923.1 Cl-channel, voltage gated [Cupriavidus taiwanensis]SOZ61085.1 Cl-channel, voltage gated [Cupriavidus taiwanensis]SOZ61178.1 Cl-channel, voltage gated [Cupriavidus taiwanensis]